MRCSTSAASELHSNADAAIPGDGGWLWPGWTGGAFTGSGGNNAVSPSTKARPSSARARAAGTPPLCFRPLPVDAQLEEDMLKRPALDVGMRSGATNSCGTALGKRRKVHLPEEPGVELNPPVKGQERTDGMFSRARLESMRIEGKRYYDALFAAEAVKTRKRSSSSSASTICVDVIAKGNPANAQGPLAGSGASALCTTPLNVVKPPSSIPGADLYCSRGVPAPPSDDWRVADGALINSTVTLSTHPVYTRLADELLQGSGDAHPPPLHCFAGQVVVRRPLGRDCAPVAAGRLKLGEEEQAHLPPDVLGEGQRCETAAAVPASPAQSEARLPLGPLSSLAAAGHWDALCEQMSKRLESMLVSGGPGVGKTTFLRKNCAYLRQKFDADGQVVVCAPTGSAAKTAVGVTYHSFFGFELKYVPQLFNPAEEASRLLATKRFGLIRRRLGRVRVLFLDEISMVPADRFDVMIELLAQSRGVADCAAVVYPFGDFLQLRPTHR